MAKNKVRNKENKKSPAKLIYRISMSIITLIFAVAIVHQYFIGVELKEQEVALLADISREEAIGLNLKNQKDNQNSPEFIEKIAREKLNMVGPKEIVFVDKNSADKKNK